MVLILENEIAGSKECENSIKRRYQVSNHIVTKSTENTIDFLID